MSSTAPLEWVGTLARPAAALKPTHNTAQYSEFAARTGLSPPDVSRLESGTGVDELTVETLARLADACELSLCVASPEVPPRSAHEIANEANAREWTFRF